MSTYIVLGGCGFIGRSIVDYLISENLASKVIVADKSRPELSWLCYKHKESFSSSKVVFIQVNLANKASLSKVFGVHKADYVINAAAEVRYGMSSQVYEEHILQLGLNCAAESMAIGAKRYIQFSTTRVHSASKKKNKEKYKNNSAIQISQSFLHLEENLSKISGLNYVIIRPSNVYGSGDKRVLTPLLILGGTYKMTGETLQLLWTKDIFMNTVHISDVSRAAIHLCTEGPSGVAYDLSDKSNSTQGSIVSIVASLFGIRYEFIGSVQSSIAKNFLDEVAEDINQKHMGPWSDACTKAGITNTPLTPYLDKEQLLYDNVQIDGSKIETTGFTYQVPQFSSQHLKDVVDEYISQNLFPKCCSP